LSTVLEVKESNSSSPPTQHSSLNMEWSV